MPSKIMDTTGGSLHFALVSCVESSMGGKSLSIIVPSPINRFDLPCLVMFYILVILLKIIERFSSCFAFQKYLLSFGKNR